MHILVAKAATQPPEVRIGNEIVKVIALPLSHVVQVVTGRDQSC